MSKQVQTTQGWRQARETTLQRDQVKSMLTSAQSLGRTSCLEIETAGDKVVETAKGELKANYRW